MDKDFEQTMAILSGGSADKFIAQQLNATDKRQIDNAKEFNSDTPRKSVNFVPINMPINRTATHVRENEHERKKIKKSPNRGFFIWIVALLYL